MFLPLFRKENDVKKTKTQKLQLHRETLTALDPQKLEEVGGARPCITSGQTTSDPTPSVCIC